jgi:hypothetical protein
MRLAVLGQRPVLRHRVEVDGVRGGVVPPVVDVEDAPLAQKRQRDRDVGERDVTARIAFVLEQRLQRVALLAELLGGAGDLLERRPRTAVLVGLAAGGDVASVRPC